jgi:hypothetical protein
MQQRAANQVPQRGIGYIQADGEAVFQSYPKLLQKAASVLSGHRQIGLRSPSGTDSNAFRLNRGRFTIFTNRLSAQQAIGGPSAWVQFNPLELGLLENPLELGLFGEVQERCCWRKQKC